MTDIEAQPQAAVPMRSVVYTLTSADLIAARRLSASMPVWRWIALSSVSGIVYMFAGAGFVSLRLEHKSLVAGIYVILFILGFLAALFGLWLRWKYLMPYRAKRIFAQYAEIRRERKVEWDASGLRMKSSQTDSIIRWAEFVRQRENAATTLLYLSDQIYLMIPKRVLTKEQADSLLKSMTRIPRKS